MCRLRHLALVFALTAVQTLRLVVGLAGPGVWLALWLCGCTFLLPGWLALLRRRWWAFRLLSLLLLLHRCLAFGSQGRRGACLHRAR